MEALIIFVTGLVEWTTNHWFLTFLILASFKGINFSFKKDEADLEEIK